MPDITQWLLDIPLPLMRLARIVPAEGSEDIHREILTHIIDFIDIKNPYHTSDLRRSSIAATRPIEAPPARMSVTEPQDECYQTSVQHCSASEPY